MQDLKTLKQKIEKVLEVYPKTRNSDIELMLQVWRTFYPQFLYTTQRGTEVVSTVSLFVLPREDHVKRVRAVIQNDEHRLLPTSEGVLKRRKILEQEWYKQLNYAYRDTEGNLTMF